MSTALIRPYLTFSSTFPDDGRIGEEGDVESPPGQVILECLREKLLTRGLFPDEIDMHDSYGWYFELRFPETRIWCMLQQSDEWLLITREIRGWKNALLGRRHPHRHAAALEALEDAIRSDSRFSSLRSFTEKEFQA